jgi:hypothetical protein
MVSEVEIIISFLFKRSGKSKLTFSELYLPLSIDLKWFAPNESKNFVNSALNKGFLLREGDLIKPNFDYLKINLPIDFDPSNKSIVSLFDLKENESDVFKLIIDQIVKISGKSEKLIQEEIQDISVSKMISKEVAALLVSIDYNLDIGRFQDQIEHKIFMNNSN